MAARFDAFAWERTPLGPVGAWPGSLRTVVDLMLGSGFAMFVAWGPDLTFLYNDRYIELLGAKHPAALGARFRDAWADVWADIEPMVGAALAGRATYHEDYPLLTTRRGFEERAWFTFSYSPVRDEAGAVAGMICAVTETSGKVRAEAALRASEARWHGLFEGMQEGILVAELVRDAAGRAVDWRYLAMNAAWETITGLSRAETVGRTLLDILPTVEPAWVQTFVRVAETGEPANFEGGVALLDKWYSVHAFRTEPDRFAALFLDITERRAADERQALMTRELDHRAKNALAVVAAALRLTRAATVEEYRRALEGRVGALARAQTLLSEDRWAGADLRGLLAGELEPFLGATTGAAGETPRAALVGPAVALPPASTQPLAMAVHELATNAVKYGALSVPAGRLRVTWEVDGAAGGGTLRLRWEEAGGPRVVAAPDRRGFGGRLLDGTVRGQLGGTVALAWEPSGLVCTIAVPLREASGENASGGAPGGAA